MSTNNTNMRTENKRKGQAGVQQWSRGEIFPATIVVKGFGANTRIQAKLGDWDGTEVPVKDNFKKAHDVAEREAVEQLKAENLF